MASTSKLGMSLIDENDYVSISPINSNFITIDSKLGNDYIAECGETVINSISWWYRKWSSGRAECGCDYHKFGRISDGNIVCSTPFENVYISDTYTFGAYPITFINVNGHPSVMPIIRVIEIDPGSAYYKYPAIRQSAIASPTTSPTFVLESATKDFAIGHPAFGIYVTGKWK